MPATLAKKTRYVTCTVLSPIVAQLYFSIKKYVIVCSKRHFSHLNQHNFINFVLAVSNYCYFWELIMNDSFFLALSVANEQQE